MVASQTSGQWEVASGRLSLVVALEPKEVGARIRAAREAKLWKQLEFALKAGVSVSVYRWEHGKLPDVRELMRVADLLDVPTTYLVEDVPSISLGEDHFVRLEAKLDEVLGLLRDVNLERFASLSDPAAPPEVPAQDG